MEGAFSSVSTDYRLFRPICYRSRNPGRFEASKGNWMFRCKMELRKRGIPVKTFRSVFLLVLCMLSIWGMEAHAESTDEAWIGEGTQYGYVNDFFRFSLGFQEDYWDWYVVNKDTQKANMKMYGYTDMMTADHDDDHIVITVYSAEHTYSADRYVAVDGLFGEEEALAGNEEALYGSELSSRKDISNVTTSVDCVDEFAGVPHYAALSKYAVNGSGESEAFNCFDMRIMLLSPDRRYLCKVDIQSSDPFHMEKICGFFSEYHGIQKTDTDENEKDLLPYLTRTLGEVKDNINVDEETTYHGGFSTSTEGQSVWFSGSYDPMISGRDQIITNIILEGNAKSIYRLGSFKIGMSKNDIQGLLRDEGYQFRSEDNDAYDEIYYNQSKDISAGVNYGSDGNVSCVLVHQGALD